jgi:Chitin binding Peritrophin-A domain
MLIFLLIFTFIRWSEGGYCATPRDDTLYTYPSVNNCSTFIVCIDNEEVEVSCMESTLFPRSSEKVCVNPCPVESTTKRAAGSKGTYEFSSDYSIFPEIGAPKYTTICPSTGETKAVIPNQCSEYIECNSGIGTRHKCEDGEDFSPLEYKCLPKEESDCKITKVRGSPNPKCRFEKENSAVVFASDTCSDFKKCAYLKAWTIKCAQNTLFDKEKKRCDWEEEVKC